VALIDFGDFNIWKCDLCHGTAVLSKKYKPEGWIEPKIVLVEGPVEITIPTVICSTCRINILKADPHNMKILSKEIFCKKDNTYKFCDTEDKVIAYSLNRLDWTYLKPDEPTCYCSSDCEYYPNSEDDDEDSTKLLDVISLSCSLCGEFSFTTPEHVPDGWIQIKTTNPHTPEQPITKLICKACSELLPQHVCNRDNKND